MNSFNTSHKTEVQSAGERRSFQRVTVNVPGRLMMANHEEYECIAADMSPGDAIVHCAAKANLNERIIAYLENVGRIEGTVFRHTDKGFVMSVVATDRKREKLAAQLTWLANKHELGLAEDRRYDRIIPRQSRSTLTLDDGRRINCRIIDLSLSGAATECDERLAIGTAVKLGNNTRGRVVRHFKEGLAIEFLALQTREALENFL
jgi:PilZ domain